MEVAMVTDGQVRKLRRLLADDVSLAQAARKTGMDEKTARRYRDTEGLPSEGRSPRDWRSAIRGHIDGGIPASVSTP